VKVLVQGDPIRRPGGQRNAVLLRPQQRLRTLKRGGMEKALMGVTDLKQVRSICIK